MRQLNPVIIESTGYDPWYNLALEEYLFKNISENEVLMFLWQNQDSVVLGRNQNAWKECRCQLLEEEGGKLARRLSGGGAVFHDLGNLNFTFIMKKGLYNLRKQLAVILRAVKKLGIEASFSGRNDLVVGEKKFSGNAFYLTGNTAYHHGTILLATDLARLTTYLQVSTAKIKSKGIESVCSPVINLCEINPALTIELVKKQLAESFNRLYGEVVRRQKVDPLALNDLADLYQKYSSWEWRYGQTPEFNITLEHHFAWGRVEITFQLKKATIKKAVVSSDAIDLSLKQDIVRALKDVTFKKTQIVEQISCLEPGPKGRKIIRDITGWLKATPI